MAAKDAQKWMLPGSLQTIQQLVREHTLAVDLYSVKISVMFAARKDSETGRTVVLGVPNESHGRLPWSGENGLDEKFSIREK